MAYSPGEQQQQQQQQQGTNSSCEWLKKRRSGGPVRTRVSPPVCLSSSASRVGELSGDA